MRTLTKEEVAKIVALIDAEIEREKEPKEAAFLAALCEKLRYELDLEGPGPYVFYKKVALA
jgi:hypothetical protein